MRYVLAIETDPNRARALERLVREHVQAHLVVADSKDAALIAIANRVPDLILIPPFLSPVDEAELMLHLRQLPNTQYVQVRIIPPLADPNELPAEKARMRAIFRRRRSKRACDPGAVGANIRDYLEEACALKAEREFDLMQKAVQAAHPDTRLPAELSAFASPTAVGTELIVADLPRESRELVRHIASERRRACRKTRPEVPWLSTVKLPRGIEVQLLDISATGALVETSAKFAPDSPTEFRLFGPNTKLVVPARFVRIEVATVDAFGVKYRAAAAFDNPIDLRDSEPRPIALSSPPETLADLVAQVQAERDRGAEPGVLRARFEKGLRELVPIRDIRIADVPIRTNDGSDSIYFTVPGKRDSAAILQAIFEANYEPTESEFSLLRVAASLTAAVLPPDRP